MTWRVGANLLWLVPGVVGGSEEYSMRLLQALLERPSPDLEMVLIVNRALPAAYPDVVASAETVVAPISGSTKAVRVAAESTWLAWAARRHSLDLVHHLGGTMPVVRSVPGVVTVHDLQPFALPEHFSRTKRAYLQAALPMSVRRARHVVTLTDHTRRDLEDRLGVPSARVSLVPSGVAQPDEDAELRRLPAVLDALGLVRGRYFLYPAITYPHKNHLVLLHALARTARTHPDVQLVLTGGAARMERRVEDEARALGVADRVVRTGRIPRDDLDALYHGAVALVFPSRFEGFGLPVLEAMVRDCPVIAADATALPEVIGEAGVLVSPTDPTAWAAAMGSLLDDDAAGDALRVAGRRRAAAYGWGDAAIRLEAVYRQVLRVAHMRITVICPHLRPDVAPTGEVMSSILDELVARGHELHVVTSLPWYRHHRIEPGWEGAMVRHEDVAWGRISRINPFPTDKGSLPARAIAFGGFTALAAAVAARGPWRPDVVFAMSPPLTLGMSGRLVASRYRAPLVFNIQDVFPDVAIEVGAISSPRIIAAASMLERRCYVASDAVTVLSDDLADNVRQKVRRGGGDPAIVRVIPNFVDTERIRPGDRDTAYRRAHDLGDRTVVLYAGNVGYSQSLDLVLDAARPARDRPDVVFVINGGGSARAALIDQAADLPNVVFVDLQPKELLPEILATGDVHLVPLRRGLARSSVPSKLYSILAAGRPVLASVDAGTEVQRTIEEAGAGIAVGPDDADAFHLALLALLDDPDRRAAMGAAGRRFVASWASPAAVAARYEALFDEVVARRRGADYGGANDRG